jgi:hypothetical protein
MNNMNNIKGAQLRSSIAHVAANDSVHSVNLLAKMQARQCRRQLCKVLC